MIVYIVISEHDCDTKTYVYQSRKSAEAKYVAIAQEVAEEYKEYCQNEGRAYEEHTINDYKDAQKFHSYLWSESESLVVGDADWELIVSRIEFAEENDT